MIVPATPIPSARSDPRVAASTHGGASIMCRSHGGRINVTVLTVVGLLAFILVAIAFVLRGPLASAVQDYRASRNRDAVRRQQDDERRALEQAIATGLSAVTSALQRLTASAQSLDSQVQAAIGMSLPDAIAHPPTPVRRAFLTSNSFRTAWTELANTAVSPARLNDLAAVPTAIAARLSAHTVGESDRQELAQVMASVQSLQARIDSIDLGFLDPKNPLTPNVP